MKIKTVSFCVATLLTLTLTGQCFAQSNPFTDLVNVSAKDKILALQEKGYVKGGTDGKFAPDRNITVAEGVQLMVNALGLNMDNIRFIKAPKATDYFPNANNEAWYADALIVASVNGLDLPSDVDPKREWTREEFVYYLIQAMEKQGNLPMINIIPANMADENQMNINYSGAIQRALVYDVVKLDAEGKFYPKTKITRADAAEQVYNAIEYMKAHPAPVVD